MPMHPRRAAARLAAILSLAVVLAGCGSTGESRSVFLAERPRWAVGDSWTYRGTGRDGAYTVTRRVVGEGVFDGHEAYEVQVGDSRYWYTKRLGYIARVNADRKVQRITPPEDWQWPLQVGKSWSATVTWMDDGPPERRVALTGVWAVEAYEEITTPAGKFKALKLTRREVESGASQELWYSPAARGLVKVKSAGTAVGPYEEELTAHSGR